jgi:hypothetical protein
MKKLTAFAVAAVTVAATAPVAKASFHLWLIDEIFSNPSGSIQFVEFSNAFDFEDFMSITSLKSNANTYPFPSNLPSSSTANKRFLVGTSGFAALPGAPTPDYIFPSNFFSITNDSLFLIGGAQPALTFTAGQLPTDGLQSLHWDGSTLSTGLNSPTNFAGVSGSVVAIPEPAGLPLLALGALALCRRVRR